MRTDRGLHRAKNGRRHDESVRPRSARLELALRVAEREAKLRRRPNHPADVLLTTKEPAFLAVDFFCGAGGTTRGLIDAGGYVIAGIDKETRCRDTFVENNRNRFLDEAKPRFFDRDVFERTAEYPTGEHEILAQELAEVIAQRRSSAPGIPLLFAICAPCQPFTTLARREMSAERLEKRERDSNLLMAAARFVAVHQPEMVLSENVAGINDPRFGGIWSEFQSELERLGYATGTRVVCVSKFGVPQYRKRSILIAVKRDVVNAERLTDLLGRQLSVPASDPAIEPMTVEKAIGHLPPLGAGETHPDVPNHRTRSLSATNIRRISCAKPGESNAYLEDTVFGDLSLPCHRRVNARLNDRCFGDVYTRMRPDGPSPTITTKCHSISNGRFGHYDVRQTRGISLREAAALQSFDDDYVFYPQNQIDPVARMIGNAVPPRLARFFASYLVGSLSQDGVVAR